MRTNTNNAVVVPFAEFLLSALKTDKTNQYQLFIQNTLNGRSDSILINSLLPRDETHLMQEFTTMLSVVTIFGFKNFEGYLEIAGEYLEELPINEAIQEYNTISEKARFALNMVGSLQRIEDLRDLDVN